MSAAHDDDVSTTGDGNESDQQKVSKERMVHTHTHTHILTRTDRQTYIIYV